MEESEVERCLGSWGIKTFTYRVALSHSIGKSQIPNYSLNPMKKQINY